MIVAEGDILEHIANTTPSHWRRGLSRQACVTYSHALSKTAWAQRHQQRVVLAEGHEVLASAERFDFTAMLDQSRVRVCGIGTIVADPKHDNEGHERALLDRLVEAAGRDGSDVALIVVSAHQASSAPAGFAKIPTTDVEIKVAESAGRGAPMTPVRSGEDRDLAAIVAMGETRARPYRFHLDRDVDLVKHAITRRRLGAGLSTGGDRQLWFMIAEEGITAAAYLVITVADRTWTIEECGDRDPSGARVGALLQALIAREPAEARPVIRAWLPPGFVPPQVTVVSATPAEEVMMMRVLRPTIPQPRLSSNDVLYWRGDIF